MKEKYSSPTMINAGTLEVSMTEKAGAFPLVAAVGAAAGYAAGRAITNAVKASPSSKLPSLTKCKE